MNATPQTWMSLVVMVGLCCGCLGRGQTDLLQVRLREQQKRLAETQAKLETTTRQLKIAKKEADGLRLQIAKSGPPGLLPEHSEVLIRAASLRINPMLTAGFDRDDLYGDDTLVLQFTPLDDENEVIRLPGDIQIRVLDPSLDVNSQTIAEWNFPASECSDHWVRGLLGSGYQFSLPWPQAPKNAELVIHVQLTTTDGREFTATHVIQITPPVVTAEASEIVPAAAEERRKPKISRPVVDDSTNWTRDEIPTLR